MDLCKAGTPVCVTTMATNDNALGGGASAAAPGSSLIFVTLKDGEYDDHWSSQLYPLLADGDIAGYRELHWCGQRKGRRDGLVRPGTLVAVRANAKVRAFTLVGAVVEKTCLTPQHDSTPGTYSLLVEVSATPLTIERAAGDRYTHWTVLRELGFPRDTGCKPHGIYG